MDIFKWLLTLMMAIFSLYIAFMQWVATRNKLAIDLFDKRFSIFNSVRTILALMCLGRAVEDRDLIEYQTAIKGAKWLFDDEMDKYLSRFLIELITDYQQLHGSWVYLENSASNRCDIDANSKLKSRIYKEYEDIGSHFSKYMKIEKDVFDYFKELCGGLKSLIKNIVYIFEKTINMRHDS